MTAVADGENGIEVIVINEPGNLPFVFHLNDPEFPDRCLWTMFALVIDVDEMLVRGLLGNLKQVGDQPLRQPDGLPIETDLKLRRAVTVVPNLNGRGMVAGSKESIRS